MVGQSPLSATEEQRKALTTLGSSRDRGEADRARAVLLTLAGWTSPRIAEAFGVREDTVRLWRSDFMRGGVAALKATVAFKTVSSRPLPFRGHPPLTEPRSNGHRISTKAASFSTGPRVGSRLRNTSKASSVTSRV